VRFDENYGNFFEEFSSLHLLPKNSTPSVQAEKVNPHYPLDTETAFRKKSRRFFLLPLSNGHEIAVWPINQRIFLPLFTWGKCHPPADVASAPYTTKWKREVRFGKNPGNFLKNFSLHSLPRNSTPLPISENPAGIEPPLWEFSFLSF